MDGTLTGIPTSGQGGPRNNVNERNTTHSPELEPHHQMQFSAIPKIPPFYSGVTVSIF